ncbi:hypothetical protein ANN_19513 [Periplaneta americana]|uniref:Uncharacterized protein n=1 Tax=Periplaneta americana TaxID=6978 RepID=A0ABQ8SAZ8_PERAM|nr:hypothetical protein ANN_19513 [Periplaneta americana]
MAGLCEDSNEPAGSLKAILSKLLEMGDPGVIDQFFPDGTIARFVSLAEKKLPTEECTGRNGEREKSSGQKKISDDRRH